MCLKAKQEFSTYKTGDMLQNNYYNNQPQTKTERHSQDTYFKWNGFHIHVKAYWVFFCGVLYKLRNFTFTGGTMY